MYDSSLFLLEGVLVCYFCLQDIIGTKNGLSMTLDLVLSML
jgi:hypothetical protein